MHSDNSAILLISGGMGCGKSVLTKLNSLSESRVTASFFNDQIGETETILTKMICTLLHQIVKARNSLIGQIELVEEYRRLSENRRSEVKWPLETLKRLFLSLQSTGDAITLYIVIDFLDGEELIEEAKQLLQKLVSSKTSCKFKIFLTCRPNTITPSWSHVRLYKISLDSIARDVASYIDEALNDFRDEEDRSSVKGELNRLSEGNFQFAEFAVQHIMKERSFGTATVGLIESLKNIASSREIKERLYGNLLRRLLEARSRIVLQWVLFCPATYEGEGISNGRYNKPDYQPHRRK